MKYFDVSQNTPEWLELRKGHFTASSANDLFLKPETAGYWNCITRVLYEKKIGQLLSEKKYNSESMSNGHEREPIAREQYENLTFTKVYNGGFCERDNWTGCSPDGLVGKDGLLQIKCPEFSTIAKYKDTGKLPLNYLRQMQFELMVTDRNWNDFYVFYPLIDPFIIRVNRDDFIIKEIESKLKLAIEKVQELLIKI